MLLDFWNIITIIIFFRGTREQEHHWEGLITYILWVGFTHEHIGLEIRVSKVKILTFGKIYRESTFPLYVCLPILQSICAQFPFCNLIEFDKLIYFIQILHNLCVGGVVWDF